MKLIDKATGGVIDVEAGYAERMIEQGQAVPAPEKKGRAAAEKPADKGGK